MSFMMFIFGEARDDGAAHLKPQSAHGPLDPRDPILDVWADLVVVLAAIRALKDDEIFVHS